MARTHNKTKSKKAIVLKSIVSIKIFWVIVVPGGGFEPPTRGFSVHCSTPELPGQGKAIIKWVIAFYGVQIRVSRGIHQFF